MDVRRDHRLGKQYYKTADCGENKQFIVDVFGNPEFNTEVQL